MRYTSDVRERLRRVRLAIVAFEWMLSEWEKQINNGES